MLTRKLLILIISLSLLSACASVFKGSSQTMSFRSEPPGATVIIDGLARGVTPLTIELQKDEFKKVTFKRKGYLKRSFNLNTRFDKIGLINLIFFPAFSIDASTGAMFAYERNNFYVELAKNDGKNAAADSFKRNARLEVSQFVMSHYSKLKQQCDKTCDNQEMKTLVLLLAKTYPQNELSIKHHAVSVIRNAEDSVDCLRKLRAGLEKAG